MLEQQPADTTGAAGLRLPANIPPGRAPRIRDCEAALRSCGLTAGLQMHGDERGSNAGVSMRVPVRHLLDSQHAMQQFVRRTQHTLRYGMPLALFFTDLDHGDAAPASLEAVCARIRSAARF